MERIEEKRVMLLVQGKGGRRGSGAVADRVPLLSGQGLDERGIMLPDRERRQVGKDSDHQQRCSGEGCNCDPKTKRW